MHVYQGTTYTLYIHIIYLVTYTNIHIIRATLMRTHVSRTLIPLCTYVYTLERHCMYVCMYTCITYA